VRVAMPDMVRGGADYSGRSVMPARSIAIWKFDEPGPGATDYSTTRPTGKR